MPGVTVRDALEDTVTTGSGSTGKMIRESDTITADYNAGASRFVDLGASGYSAGLRTGPESRGPMLRVTLELVIGAVSGTNPRFTLMILGSTSALEVSYLGAFELTEANANSTLYLTLETDKRFISDVGRVMGTTPSFAITSLKVLANPHMYRNPLANDRPSG